MKVLARATARLGALLLASALGPAALAQQPAATGEVISFTAEGVVPTEPEPVQPGTVTLMPVRIPSASPSAGGPVARVVPVAPRVLVRAAGAVRVPPVAGAVWYSTRPAGITSLTVTSRY